MSESTVRGTLRYRLRRHFVSNGTTWEFWEGCREIAMLRRVVPPHFLELDGEWLGSVLKSYLEVKIPAQVVIAGLPLDEGQIEVLTAEMHLALSAMKLRHVLVRSKPWQPLTESDRDAVLEEFHQWMDQHGWRVVMERNGARLSVRRKGIRWFSRLEASSQHVFEQGAWVARALHVMLNLPLDHTTLFVGQGARPLSHLVDLDW